MGNKITIEQARKEYSSRAVATALIMAVAKELGHKVVTDNVRYPDVRRLKDITKKGK